MLRSHRPQQRQRPLDAGAFPSDLIPPGVGEGWRLPAAVGGSDVAESGCGFCASAPGNYRCPRFWLPCGRMRPGFKPGRRPGRMPNAGSSTGALPGNPPGGGTWLNQQPSAYPQPYGLPRPGTRRGGCNPARIVQEAAFWVRRRNPIEGTALTLTRPNARRMIRPDCYSSPRGSPEGLAGFFISNDGIVPIYWSQVHGKITLTPGRPAGPRVATGPWPG